MNSKVASGCSQVIDTPGIVEAGFDQTTIAWLRNMVSEYMKEENTIILVAIECSGKVASFVGAEIDPARESPCHRRSGESKHGRA